MSANHVRAQIRALLVSRLKGAGVTDAGLNVFDSKMTAYGPGQLPAINVTLGAERIQRGAMGGTQDRVMDVRFDVTAQSGDATAALLDKVCGQIETRIKEGAWSSALIFDLEVTSIDELFDGEGMTKAGQLRLTAAVQYTTNEGAPTVAAN